MCRGLNTGHCVYSEGPCTSVEGDTGLCVYSEGTCTCVEG